MKNRALIIKILAAFALAAAVFLWKMIGRGMTIPEIWTMFLVDWAVLFVLIYLIGLLNGSSYFYFRRYQQKGLWEDLGLPSNYQEYEYFDTNYGVKNMSLGLIITCVLWGTLLSFLWIRIFLVESGRDDTYAVLNKNNAIEIAQNFLHVNNQEYGVLAGTENYRYYLSPDEDFGKRLNEAARLRKNITEQFAPQKILFCQWNKANFNVYNVKEEKTDNGIKLHFDANRVTAKLEDFRECDAKFEAFDILLKPDPDNKYRVAQFPENITVTLLPETARESSFQ